MFEFKESPSERLIEPPEASALDKSLISRSPPAILKLEDEICPSWLAPDDNIKLVFDMSAGESLTHLSLGDLPQIRSNQVPDIFADDFIGAAALPDTLGVVDETHTQIAIEVADQRPQRGKCAEGAVKHVRSRVTPSRLTNVPIRCDHPPAIRQLLTKMYPRDRLFVRIMYGHFKRRMRGGGGGIAHLPRVG